MRQLLRTTATVFVALVFTAGMAFGQDNESVVEQQGSQNATSVTQQGTDTFADVSQDGTGNSGTILQNGKIDASERDVAQTDLNQSGTRNSARIEQIRTDFDANAPLKVELTQEGRQNAANIFQKGRGDGATGSMSGVGNVLDVDQIGQFGEFRFTVEGRNNYVRGYQKGVNDTEITVDGRGNSFFAEQYQGRNEIGGEIVGSRNDVDVYQNGSGNEVVGSSGKPFTRDGLLVNGSNNALNITQTGNGQLSQVTQSGSGNSATITQSN
jgi:hypothetical protein